MKSILKIKHAFDNRTSEPSIPVKKTLNTPASVREQDKKNNTTAKP